MADERIEYQNVGGDGGVDSDVFFTGFGGPVSPEMRSEWIEAHEEAISHPNIEYDNDTGYYELSMKVPDEVASNYTENRDSAQEMYAKQPKLSLVFSSAGVFIVGTVEEPGAATMLAKFIEDSPRIAQPA